MTILGLDIPKDKGPAPGAPEISLVVPVHNETNNVRPLVERVRAALQNLEHEIVFIDDGSKDDSLEKLRALARENRNVKVISLSRNFGHQVAVTVGMEYARGQAIVIIDADLQDPPEVIPDMIAKWREGYEVVYGQRTRRAGESWAKLATA